MIIVISSKVSYHFLIQSGIIIIPDSSCEQVSVCCSKTDWNSLTFHALWAIHMYFSQVLLGSLDWLCPLWLPGLKTSLLKYNSMTIAQLCIKTHLRTWARPSPRYGVLQICHTTSIVTECTIPQIIFYSLEKSFSIATVIKI